MCLTPVHPFTKQIVPSLYQQSLTCGSLQSIILFCHTSPINAFLPWITILRACCFFLLCLFHFHRTLFRGLVGACVNPRCLSLFVHSLVCQIISAVLVPYMSIQSGEFIIQGSISTIQLHACVILCYFAGNYLC